MNSLDYEPGCNNKDLFNMSEVEEVEDLWPLCLQRMQQDQLSDEKFQKEVELLMKQSPSQFTKKEINRVELIHENDRVLVPQGS